MQQRPLPAPAGSPASMILMRITMVGNMVVIMVRIIMVVIMVRIIMVRIIVVIMIRITHFHDSDEDRRGGD